MWTRCRIEPGFFKTLVFRPSNRQFASWTDLPDPQSAEPGCPADSRWSASVGAGCDLSHTVRASSVMRFQAWFGSGGAGFPGARQTTPSGCAPSDVDFEAVILRRTGMSQAFSRSVTGSGYALPGRLQASLNSSLAMREVSRRCFFSGSTHTLRLLALPATPCEILVHQIFHECDCIVGHGFHAT